MFPDQQLSAVQMERAKLQWKRGHSTVHLLHNPSHQQRGRRLELEVNLDKSVQEWPGLTFVLLIGRTTKFHILLLSLFMRSGGRVGKADGCNITISF